MKRSIEFRAVAGLAAVVVSASLSCSTKEGRAPRLDIGVVRSALTVSIDTCSELQDMENDLDGDYELTANLDCTTFDYGDSGGFMPVGSTAVTWDPFTGTFDGNGHTITGLTIDRPNDDDIGLFGALEEDAIVTGVGLVDADITGGSMVGAIAGTVLEDAVITESFATGIVTGRRARRRPCGLPRRWPDCGLVFDDQRDGLDLRGPYHGQDRGWHRRPLLLGG
jgi:hypothetical protein